MPQSLLNLKLQLREKYNIYSYKHLCKMIKLKDLLLEIIDNPKAIILAGAPGAGKGYILRGLDLTGLTTLNIDNTFINLLRKANVSLDLKNATPEERSKAAQAMAAATKELKTNIIPKAIANRESFILDGTASSLKNTLKLKNELEEAGYEVIMVYVYTDLERALKQNQERFEREGGEDRSLSPSIVLSSWNSVTKNFEPYQQEFGENFISIANTGKALKDLDQIVDKYLKPFKPKDTKPKTPKQVERSKKQWDKLSQEINTFLSSDHTQNIIDTSISREEAQTKIKSFLG